MRKNNLIHKSIINQCNNFQMIKSKIKKLLNTISNWKKLQLLTKDLNQWMITNQKRVNLRKKFKNQKKRKQLQNLRKSTKRQVKKISP